MRDLACDRADIQVRQFAENAIDRDKGGLFSGARIAPKPPLPMKSICRRVGASRRPACRFKRFEFVVLVKSVDRARTGTGLVIDVTAGAAGVL